MKIKLSIVALMLSLSSLVASEIMVQNAYVRATPPGTPNTAAFMTIMNKASSSIEVVGARSSVAKMVQVHQHTMHNGMMKMSHVKRLKLDAMSHLDFKPGGYHVMFMGMKKRLNDGEMAEFTLVFSDGSELKIDAPVKKAMAGMKHDKSSVHKKMSGMNASEMKKEH